MEAWKMSAISETAVPFIGIGFAFFLDGRVSQVLLWFLYFDALHFRGKKRRFFLCSFFIGPHFFSFSRFYITDRFLVFVLVYAGTNERRYLNYIEAFITRNCSGIVSLFYTVCASRHRRQRLVSSSVRFRRISYSSSDRVLELGFGFPLNRIRNCPGLMGVWCASYFSPLASLC